MLSTLLVLEISRLLQEGRLSQRQIALRLRVSRGTVNAIAHGRRGVYGRDPDEPARTDGPGFTLPARCAECGGMVFPPCRLCQARVCRQRTERLRSLAG